MGACQVLFCKCDEAMRKLKRFLLGYTLVLASGIGFTADVTFVDGTIIEPEGLNEGDTVRRGTRIVTGVDALIMIEYRWRSDVSGYDCIHVAIIGNGQPYTVQTVETPGQCDIRAPTNPNNLSADQPIMEEEFRYADASFDDPNMPDRVRASRSQWQTFDRWTRNAERTFTGEVTSVSSSSIQMRSAHSGQLRRFSIDSATIQSPVALDSLRGDDIQLIYRMANSGPQAIRVITQSIEPILAPVQIAFDPVIVGQVVTPGGDTPQNGGAPALVEWKCSLDLHQGDIGVLMIEQRGARILGTIYIERGEQEHAIGGMWKDNKITFNRRLSETSRQPFTGVVTKANDGSMKMGGRFAANFNGVWSADCKR